MALTEFAIVAPILVLVAMGVAEFGLAWRDSMTVSGALRSSARVASNSGSDRLADYDAIQALEASIAAIPDTDIEQVVIFNAGTDSTPTPGCRAGTPSSAPGFECNVYAASDFDRPASDFDGVVVMTRLQLCIRLGISGATVTENPSRCIRST